MNSSVKSSKKIPTLQKVEEEKKRENERGKRDLLSTLQASDRTASLHLLRARVSSHSILSNGQLRSAFLSRRSSSPVQLSDAWARLRVLASLFAIAQGCLCFCFQMKCQESSFLPNELHEQGPLFTTVRTKRRVSFNWNSTQVQPTVVTTAPILSQNRPNVEQPSQLLLLTQPNTTDQIQSFKTRVLLPPPPPDAPCITPFLICPSYKTDVNIRFAFNGC
ncbi:hypothetical protein LR48_Vigan272s000100 [Vigna angularis]|uniref:Uncharacterized protein n=1 Tax=Phaseolus angularis TaxID=3914 RepID=A0A0L9T761_PHAAN|nr:hypothetical protein LR48_Vigan272s000100 [Vigna angularis]